MDGYVEVEELRTGPNHIMNILWDRNAATTLEELAEEVGARFHVSWSKRKVQKYIDQLVRSGYVVEVRDSGEVSYAALGYDLEGE